MTPGAPGIVRWPLVEEAADGAACDRGSSEVLARNREYLEGETLEPQRPVDYAVYNHFTSTHPASPFVGRMVAIRNAPGIRHTLRGRELVCARPNGSTERRELADEEIPKVLGQTFGVLLEPGDLPRLRPYA